MTLKINFRLNVRQIDALYQLRSTEDSKGSSLSHIHGKESKKLFGSAKILTYTLAEVLSLYYIQFSRQLANEPVGCNSSFKP